MNISRILLMGNPNVGKSSVFSRLTGARVMISNYPGTTVEFTQGRIKLAGESVMIVDVPGTYTLEATCKAEDVACRMVKEGGLIVNVVDATNLERNLHLTLQLLEQGLPLVVALNMWDDTKHRGIHIDVKKLEEQLGVPVVPVCGLSGEGIKELVERLPEAKQPQVPVSSDMQKWEKIGAIIESVQKLTHRHHTLLEMLEDWSIKPFSGLAIAAGVIYCAFWVIRFVGEGLIGYVFEPLFERAWLPAMMKLSALLGEGTFLHHILIGDLIENSIDLGQSFGLLTTGLYLPIAMVLPYIFSFYLVLGFLEDLGYLPRLAVLMDNFMHHLGLHGYAIIPFILGCGCNVPGALALRILEEKREKFIAATLMAISIPCMAQIAMIVGLVGQRGGKYVLVVLGTLGALLVIKGLILNRVLKGASPEILIEIPPYRMPQAAAVLKKLWMRLSGFLKEALPFVLLGVLFINVLHALNVIHFLAYIFSPILTRLWGLPEDAIGALVVGFLRKDVAVGMLGPLDLTTKQLVIGSTILAVYFPCIATFVVLIRELGIKDMLKSAAIMVAVSIVVGAALNLILP
ncbi:MAG: ferrous iron transporter B [Candidatus Omnitrophica bacterium]|nr:ferrous iron transporter B [Candidatus Omnitrophota bacterium]